jgi:hypothetical protein
LENRWICSAVAECDIRVSGESLSKGFEQHETTFQTRS